MTYKKIKILFIGTVEFSYKALSILIENNFEIVGLITKKESNFNADFYDLTPLANNNKIPILYREKDNQDEIISFIKANTPDVIYCFGWSHILPNSVLSIPPYGVIGFHPAELPNNRGRHPIIWAIFLGLKETASTFFIMDEGADTGDIISQEKIKIKDDDASTLYLKIINTGLNQILSFTNDLDRNKGIIKKIVQDKNDGNSWRKRNKNDGKIDFRMSTKAILNLIKALTYPYVGAHIEYLDNDIKIWRAKEEKCVFINYEPGKILKIEGNEIIVKTYDGAVRILEHEFTNLPIKGTYL
jgi:methionyl-tRNA formyltransferase